MRKASQQVVDHFDEMAQAVGWENDWGSPASAQRAVRNHSEAKAALVARIERLEKQNSNLTMRLRRHK